MKLKKTLMRGIQEEYLSINKLFEEIDITSDNIIHDIELLEDFKENELLVSQIIDGSSDYLKLYSKLFDSYISLVSKIKEISEFPGFMEDLKNKNKKLYDYVILVSDSIDKDKNIVIQKKYFLFLKMHGFNKTEKKDIDEIEEKLDYYFKILKNNMINPILKMNIKGDMDRRYISKTFQQNIKSLSQKTKKIKMYVSQDELDSYMPISIHKISIFYQEVTQISSAPKNQRIGKYDKNDKALQNRKYNRIFNRK